MLATSKELKKLREEVKELRLDIFGGRPKKDTAFGLLESLYFPFTSMAQKPITDRIREIDKKVDMLMEYLGVHEAHTESKHHIIKKSTKREK